MPEPDWKAEAEKFLHAHELGRGLYGAIAIALRDAYERGLRESEDTAVLAWLEKNRMEMRKRVWVDGQELPDGAIPCWWIDKEIDRLRAAIARSRKEGE